jgi:hypothetical protein
MLGGGLMKIVNCIGAGVVLAISAAAATPQVVTPRVRDVDLRTLPASPVWTPGSPVREVPDLKRTDAADAAMQTLGDHTVRVVDRSLLFARAGARVAGPLTFASLWPDGAEPCVVDVERPPVVQVDRAGGRWVISRWFQPSADRRLPLCVAVSKTADPVTGGWWLYDFALPIAREAPLEISSDGYRIASEAGAARVLISLDRAAMLAGKPTGFSVSTR